MKNALASIILFSLAVTPLAATAQDNPELAEVCENCIPAGDARSDLQSLLTLLEGEHVDLYARVSRSDYEAKIAELEARIDGPVPRPDYNLLIQEAMSFGKIGHAKTDSVIQDVITHVGNGGSIIPLSVTWRGQSLLTDEWAIEDGDALPPASRIESIGDLSIDEFVERAHPLISADNDRLLRSQMELAFPAYLYLVFGDVEHLEIGYVSPGGRRGQVAVPARRYEEMFALQAARPVPSATVSSTTRVHRDLGDRVYYIKPGPFYLNEDERGEDGDVYAIGPFDEFVEEAFAGMAESGAEALLIDLRNNPGGDVSFSDLIMGRLSQEPFQMARSYTVRAGANTKAIWAERAISGDTLGGRVAEAMKTTSAGQAAEIDLPLIQPIADKAFYGRVFALVDRHSYSNTAVFAAQLQDLGIATIMGEETADLPTTYGAVETLQLERTQVPITYPKAFMVRHSNAAPLRGIVPDFVIASNPVGSNGDRMLEIARTQVILTR